MIDLANIRAVVLDFDGTLAPIRKDPSKAKIPKYLNAVLSGLVKRNVNVVILSGRPVSFLAAQEFTKEIVLRGSFGNISIDTKSWFPGQLFLDAINEITKIQGVFVEHKVGLAIHYRNVRGRGKMDVERLLSLAEKQTNGIVVIRGRKVVEFLPPGTITKADAIEEIYNNLQCNLLYIGDDISDMEGMKRLREKKNFRAMIMESKEIPHSDWPESIKTQKKLAEILNLVGRG